MSTVREEADSSGRNLAILRHLTVGAFFLTLMPFITGCGMLLRGGGTMVSVQTDPPGATIYLDGERLPGTTPSDLMLIRTRHDLALEKDGYAGMQLAVTTCVYRYTIPLVVLDLIPMGAGVVLDLQGDGYLDLDPKHIKATLLRATSADVERMNQRIGVFRPGPTTGMGGICVYHVNTIPLRQRLFVSVEPEPNKPEPNRTQDKTIEVSVDTPAIFNVRAGKWTVDICRHDRTVMLTAAVSVETGKVVYVRCRSDIGDRSSSLPWGETAQIVPEREALTDLYYWNSYQRSVQLAPTY